MNTLRRSFVALSKLASFSAVLLMGCASETETTDDSNSAVTEETSSAVECELESVQQALIELIADWNNDGAEIGTTYAAASVERKGGSDATSGTFVNTVSVSIFEAGRGREYEFPVDVRMQKVGGVCTPPPPLTPQLIQAGRECEIQGVAGVLVRAVHAWDNRGAAIGTSFKATSVTLLPGEDGEYSTKVGVEIFEAGRGSTRRVTDEIAVIDDGSGECTAFP
jgi:hypothetical protein